MLPPTAYQAVFAGSPVPGYLLSPTSELIILDVNDAFLLASGRRREDLVGVGLFEAFPEDPNDAKDTGVSALRSSLERVIATGEPHNLPLQRYPIAVQDDSGEPAFQERYWSAVNTPIFDGKRLVCISHRTMDVTELVSDGSAGMDIAAFAGASSYPRVGLLTRAQTISAVNQALQAERQRMHYLFEHAPGFVYFTRGPEHIMEQANNAFFDLVGERDIIEKPVRAAFPDLEGQGFFELLDEVYRSGEPHIGHATRVMLQRRPETPPDEVFIDFVYQPIRDADGSVIGICAQGNDITERRRAELDLQDAARRKDEFLAMLAHELRNPLAPISAASHLLGMPGLGEERLKQTSAVIARQVRHMTGLIDDLLDVSRVTRGLVRIDKTPQDMNGVLANAVEQVRPLIETYRHQLDMALPGESLQVCGDQKRLVQVITNLLNNAVKYTPSAGRIGLRMDGSDEWVRVEVSDNGIGIGPELQPRVFDLFSQAERSPDRSLGGLGLGLALVKSLVELHGGTVSCFSAGLGEGSTFTVMLPRLVQQTRDAQAAQLHVRQGAATGLKVLIVDDNIDAARTMAILLESDGHEVAVEHAGLPAIQRALATRPDVYLLDVGLPDVSGVDLVRRLKAHKALAGGLFIAITGYGQDVDRRTGLQSGFDHYLVKPVDIDALLDLIPTVPPRAGAPQDEDMPHIPSGRSGQERAGAGERPA